MVCLEHSSRVHFLCKNLQGELLGGNIKKERKRLYVQPSTRVVTCCWLVYCCLAVRCLGQTSVGRQTDPTCSSAKCRQAGRCVDVVCGARCEAAVPSRSGGPCGAVVASSPRLASGWRPQPPPARWLCCGGGGGWTRAD
jgi:hypothetical protein